MSATERCRSDDELQAWIAGELDARADAVLERHVAACAVCSAKLHDLAALDETLRAAARTIAPPRRPLFAGRGSLPGAFAVAAALVVGLRLPSPWHTAELAADRAHASVEICADPEAASCTSPIDPATPEGALATFPDDDDPSARGLCIADDEWPEPVCLDGELLAG